MIGEKIKELREARWLTQEQMSQQLGININTLASYERNIREPRIETIKQFCTFFGVSSDYLLGLSSYQNTAHSEAIDALFSKLSPDMKSQCTEVQLDLIKAADAFRWAGESKLTTEELLSFLVNDLRGCIKAYQSLVEDNTPETNWETNPEFFAEQFMLSKAQSLENTSKVVSCIYRRGSIFADAILKRSLGTEEKPDGEHS